MLCGKYNEPIKVLKCVDKDNEWGEVVEDYVLDRTTKASIGHSGGSRGLISYELQIPTRLEVYVRSYVKIEDRTRLVIRGKEYRIENYWLDKVKNHIKCEVELVNQ